MSIDLVSNSLALWQEEANYAPGGAQGSGRYYNPFPLYFDRALGSRIRDVDGREFIDFVGSQGPAVLGLGEPRVAGAVAAAMQEEGMLVAYPHPREVQLAETVCRLIPYAEMVTFHGGGGSDAVYHAIRVARAHTGRRKILKFEGCYHGWHDEVAISARPSPAEAGPYEDPTPVAISKGALAEHAENCVVAHLNDSEMLEKLAGRHGRELAAIIVEPVVHSSGCILLRREFLQLLRQVCDAYGIVLVFDEVVTGFRHALSGAGPQLGVYPDLAALGKAMSNGFVISALAGRRDLMSLFAPSGPAYFSGTFNAHPVGVAAAQETIRIMEEEPVHERLFELGDLVGTEINSEIERLGVNAVCQSYGSVWCLFFGVRKVERYRDIIHMASSKDDTMNAAYRGYLRERDILLLPFFTNRVYMSYAHSDDDIGRMIDATKGFLRENRSALT